MVAGEAEDRWVTEWGRNGGCGGEEHEEPGGVAAHFGRGCLRVEMHGNEWW